MRTLIKWAKTNPWTIRFLLFFVQTLLILLALDLGLFLDAKSVLIPDCIFYYLLIMIGISILISPSKKLFSKSKTHFYHRVLRARLLLVISGFLAFTILGSQLPERLDLDDPFEEPSMDVQVVPIVFDVKPRRGDVQQSEEFRKRNRRLNQKPNGQHRVKKNKKRDRRRQRIAKQNRKVWKKRLRQQAKQRYDKHKSKKSNKLGWIGLILILLPITLIISFTILNALGIVGVGTSSSSSMILGDYSGMWKPVALLGLMGGLLLSGIVLLIVNYYQRKRQKKS